MSVHAGAAPYRDTILGLAFLMGGLIVWSAKFLFVYGFTGAACAKGFGEANIGPFGAIQLVILVATLFALAGNVWLIARGLAVQRIALARSRQEPAHFVGSVAAAIAALSILAIVWETVPVFMLPPCA